MLFATLAGPAGAVAEDAAPADGRVVIAVLPFGTTVEQIANVPGLAPGLISAGLGTVPVAQTFLDIGQGNRVNESLYDRDLPNLYVRNGRVPNRLWRQVLERADSAPANIVPGLLATTLEQAGVPVAAEPDGGLATLVAVDGEGAARIARGGACEQGCGPGLSVLRARLSELRDLARALRTDDTLIAFAAGARAQQELLPAGIAGPGFDGDLTSSSTRTDGLVVSTDLAPTVLDRLGLDAPDQMNGSVISSESERDPAAVADLQSRLEHRPSRDTVVLLPLCVWLLICALATLIWRRRGAQVALRLLALALAWAPLMLLVAAAPDAGELASALIVGLGAAALAVAGDRAVPGCGGLALACAASVLAYAVDVVLGSHLTAFSVLGPNPGGGVRFFGIGNELEAVLAALTLIGTGAFLEARAPVERRSAALWFVGVAVVVAAALAPGRFGADVGAAIVLAVGAATAAALALGLGPRRAALVVVGGGALALAALFAVDLVLGGAHLSRSVLDAGGAADVLDVLDRRVTLMAHTFTHPVYPLLLGPAILLLALGIVMRDRVLGWFGDRWAARCGFLGAVAGVLVGTVANDSGSVLLVIGVIYVTVAAGFFWATGRSGAGERRSGRPAE